MDLALSRLNGGWRFKKMTEANSNGDGSRGRIAALLPKQIVKVELLTPENESSGVVVVYGALDGETKTRYDRYLEAGIGRRGSKRSGFDEAISYIFKRKCQE